MPQLLVSDIKLLVNVREKSYLLKGRELANLPCIENAYLLIDNGIIGGFGKMDSLPQSIKSIPVSSRIDASRSMILPAWCDSHTHIVFSGSRETEFVDKIRGMTYAEINARGGGILESARKVNAASEDELFINAWNRVGEVARMGTGAIEIKSGYGLSVEGELKMLRVIKKLKQKSKLRIKSTFLGAHSYPAEFRENHQEYIDSILNHMIPVISRDGLADFIDVFCDKGFFNPEEMSVICRAAMDHGMKPKLHVNQLHSVGGIEAGLSLPALSLDHLESITESEIDLLAGRTHLNGYPPWEGACTLLPTAAFFLRMNHPPARKLIDAGAGIAIASDYNPGSSPSGNMNLVVAMSCIQMRMLPEESINAATLNGAWAMDCSEELGSITLGKKANLIFTRSIPSLAYIPYSFGTDCIDRVMIGGEWVR
ncbi:MAG: imidazolonepropionase [Chitinophagales bacterium]